MAQHQQKADLRPPPARPYKTRTRCSLCQPCIANYSPRHPHPLDPARAFEVCASMSATAVEEEVVEQTLHISREVKLYQIPPRSATGHKSGEWKVADEVRCEPEIRPCLCCLHAVYRPSRILCTIDAFTPECMGLYRRNDGSAGRGGVSEMPAASGCALYPGRLDRHSPSIACIVGPWQRE